MCTPLSEATNISKVIEEVNTLANNSQGLGFFNRTDTCFSEGISKKLISNHHIDWDEIAYIATMAYNIFPHSSAGEAPFYLLFGHGAFMPTLLKLLLLKFRYMGEENVEFIWMPCKKLYDDSIKP